MLTDSIIRGLFMLTLFGGYALLWRLKRRAQRATTGIDPEVMQRDPRPTQRYSSGMIKLLRLSMIALIILHAWGGLEGIGLQPWLDLSLTISLIGGGLFGFGGLGICLIAQRTMGASWRVGIDQEREAALITRGVYQWMRNPTYTGLFGVCVAILWLFPTFLFALWILAFFLVMEFQVRLEEEHLLEEFGADYQAYSARVKRYLPFIY